MKKLVSLLVLTIIGSNCNAQKSVSLDFNNWYKMDSVICNIDNDEKPDKIIIYNFKKMNKPSNVVFPVSIELTKSKSKQIGNYIIGKKEYFFQDINTGKFTLVQKGEKDDKNFYYLTFQYDENIGKLKLVKSQVVIEIKKGKLDPKTGNFIYSDVKRKITSEKQYGSSNVILFENINFYQFF